jgi:hypothetical protein
MSAAVIDSATRKTQFDQRLIVILGYAGILPMLGCLLMIESSWSLALLKSYSLAIIAFLAGNWWSTALMRRGTSARELKLILLLSNAVVITAVVAVSFLGTLSLLTLALLFVCLLMGERLLNVFRQQPAYYRSMRTGVTMLVVALHLSAFWRLL